MIIQNKLGINDQMELDRKIYMKGIEVSYNYEGYSLFNIEELNREN